MINITLDELLDQVRALDREAVDADPDCIAEADALGRLAADPKLYPLFAYMTRAVRSTQSLNPVFLYGLQIGYRLAEARYMRKMMEGE